MVRRKKSLLFTASLASAGLVAGALFAVAPKTQAAEDAYGAATNDTALQSISKDAGISVSEVKESLDTLTLIINNVDEGELKNNVDVVEYNKVAESVYTVTFKDYESTFKNYLYFNDDSKGTKAELNVPLEIMDTKVRVNPGSLSVETGVPEIDKCASVGKDDFVYSNYTKVPDQCLSWGTDTMKQVNYAKTINSAKTVKVAVIDSGIRASHYAFSYTGVGAKDRLDMTLAHDFYGNDKNPDDGDNAYEGQYRITHGTSVAGTITESTAQNVKVVPIRVTNGKQLNMATVLDAVSAVKGKVDVINLSLGTKAKYSPGDQDYEAANKVLREAKAAGTIIVAASGNGGYNYVSWPASSEYTIAVGAVDSSNKVTSFSQYGGQIDFSAPGDGLLLPAGDSDSAMALVSGTSFSTPLISAAIANILSENPTMSYDQVYKTLRLNAEDIETTGKDTKSGWGSVSFHINKLADIKMTASGPQKWTKGSATIAASATSDAYNINKYAVLSGKSTDVAPGSWKTVSTPAKSVNISESVNENGTYTVWFKNANNEVSAKTVTVNAIDKKAPTISTGFAVTEISEESATLSIGIKDTASGLSKIVWHYKAEDDEEYTDETEIYSEGNTGETAVATKTFALTGLEADGTYMAYATVYDIAGNSKDSAIATFKAVFNGEPVFTEGDKEEPEPTPVTPAKQPVNTAKPVKVANPNTSDVNLSAIAGMGGALLAAAFFVFRTKRR